MNKKKAAGLLLEPGGLLDLPSHSLAEMAEEGRDTPTLFSAVI